MDLRRKAPAFPAEEQVGQAKPLWDIAASNKVQNPAAGTCAEAMAVLLCRVCPCWQETVARIIQSSAITFNKLLTTRGLAVPVLLTSLNQTFLAMKQREDDPQGPNVLWMAEVLHDFHQRESGS